jgi:K+-sensing histidine kinase KdpD
MKIKNSRRWVRHSPWVIVRDTFGILLFAFLLRYAIHDFIEPYAPFHFFILACLFISIRYGYKAAVSGVVIGSILATFFFVKPYNSFGILTEQDIIQIFNFWLVTLVAIFVIEKLQRTIYSQKLIIKMMNDRQRSLLFRKNELLSKLRAAGVVR